MDADFKGAEQHYDDAISTLRNNPRKFFKVVGFYFICVLLIGIVLVIPSIFASYFSKESRPSREPFSSTQTTYSNIVPQEGDIIRLDYAGTLTPSPFNVPITFSKTADACIPSGEPLSYAQGILLVLNLPTILTSSGGKGIGFDPPPTENYFKFKLGESHEITTNRRTFHVTLSHIRDLSTEENGHYFAYVFDINEK